MYTRFGYFVEDIDRFDSAAFRLSYVEASAMDPASRILLEQTQARVRTCASPLQITYLP